MYIICSDLEGVFTPEIWIGVSRKTRIEELKLTTRDISDYDALMKRRLEILREHNLTLTDIQYVISTMSPLSGALEFLNWARSVMQVVIVSDTFTEFAGPLIKRLGNPVIFCHHLTVDEFGTIVNYNLRQQDSKRKTVKALQDLNYKVIAIGDSYNDINMLRQADNAILYNPPDKVREENSDLAVANSYDQLREQIEIIIANPEQV